MSIDIISPHFQKWEITKLRERESEVTATIMMYHDASRSPSSRLQYLRLVTLVLTATEVNSHLARMNPLNLAFHPRTFLAQTFGENFNGFPAAFYDFVNPRAHIDEAATVLSDRK